ncbi:hypothetical protein Zmor_021760 [Zophobas morio]|uniref:Ig-like domain-containing protein n=1 Tax=Zophobas morio TaxID=2755281 RepID=A0AA38I6Q6_9CUCU|nr:hypothetical protein Zmor_021760 [Zophobas morio]
MISNNPLSADRVYEIPCQTFGSRPPAKITWSMDNKELLPPKYNYSQTDSPDGNVTTSTLSFVATRQDNGRTLTCRASNHLVQNGVEEATVKLNVFYVPILHLSLGSSLNPDDIEEGDDVYFECKVNANPEAYKVLWKHNADNRREIEDVGTEVMETLMLLKGSLFDSRPPNVMISVPQIESLGSRVIEMMGKLRRVLRKE